MDLLHGREGGGGIKGFSQAPSRLHRLDQVSSTIFRSTLLRTETVTGIVIVIEIEIVTEIEIESETKTETDTR